MHDFHLVLLSSPVWARSSRSRESSSQVSSLTFNTVLFVNREFSDIETINYYIAYCNFHILMFFFSLSWFYTTPRVHLKPCVWTPATSAAWTTSSSPITSTQSGSRWPPWSASNFRWFSSKAQKIQPGNHEICLFLINLAWKKNFTQFFLFPFMFFI